MVYRNKEGYADPTAGAAIHETEPKAKKREYNPEVTNLVSVLKQMIDIAGYEMVGRIVLRDKDTGKEYSCLLYTSPSPRDRTRSRMPSSA